MSAGIALLKKVPYVGTALTWAPWVIAGLALAWGAIAQIGWERCSAARISEALKAKEKAERLSNELVIEQAKAMAATTEKAVTYVDRIRTVQVPRECPADERDRITNRGVRDIIHGAPE